MAIHVPGPRLLSSIKFKYLVKGAGSAGGPRAANVSLNLTPFVDMMTILVTFLLMVFSSSGELLTAQKGLDLPLAVSQAELQMAPIIVIDKTDIKFINGPTPQQIASVDATLKDEGMKVEALFERLEAADRAIKDGVRDGKLPKDLKKACEDAQILKAQFNGGDYWGKLFNCPQIMADIKPSMQRTYIYEVYFNDMKYDFRVSNPKVDMDNGVSFKYKLTGDVGTNGTVNISKEAIATAHDQMNKFGKETLELNNKTSVWISKEVFNEFKTNGYSSINANDWEGTKEFQLVSEKNSEDSYFPVTIDDEIKYIKCIKVLAKNGEELWINDDVNNPIILKMKVDFSIELKQVL